MKESPAQLGENLQQVLSQVPALHGRAVSVQPLGGGLTNRNYRLETDGAVYVLRIAGADTGLLGIDRAREVACCQAAAAAGVGPHVLAYLPEQGVLVTEFVPGRLLSSADTQQTDLLDRLARTLRRYHDQPAPPGLGAFCPFATVRNYRTVAQEKNVPLPPDLAGALEVLRRVECALRTNEAPCLCHNDLLPGNLIDDGTTLRIIDWEYAGLGDRFFDLGNCAAMNQLNAEQERALLSGYFGVVQPDHLRRLRLMRLVSDLRDALWGYVQAGISTLESPAYYLNYGRRHLDRFLAGAHELGLTD